MVSIDTFVQWTPLTATAQISREVRMPNTHPLTRRRFLSAASMALAAAEIGVVSARSESGMGRPTEALTRRGAQTSFGPLKQIDAGLLNVGYADVGPSNGPAVVLLHGWPYDIHSYVDVAPLLASSG